MSSQKSTTVYKSKQEKPKQPSVLTRLSIKVFRRLALSLGRRMPEVTQALRKSGSRTPPENYLSVVLMLSTLSTIPALISLLAFLALMTNLGLILSTPLAWLTTLPIPPLMWLLITPTPVLTLVIGLAKPWLGSSSRSSAIDTELPYVVSYFSLLSSGGISLLVTLRRMSKIQLFPMLSKEAKRILTDIDMVGLDPVSAIEKSARSNPNKDFSEFFAGYVTLLRAGGSLVGYMDAKIHDIFTHKMMKLKSSSNLIGLLAEAYVAATVVMGLSFYLIFTLQSMITKSGNTGMSNAVFFSSVFVPLISILFLYLTDIFQVKDEPVTPLKGYRTAFLSLTLIPLIMIIPIDIPLYLKLGIGLIAAVIPPMIKHEREARRRKSVENTLPNFLRDLAEVRKTGLSPEKCIQQVSNRDYGGLTKYVQKMAAQIGWGVSIKKVMESFANSVTVWPAKAVAFILLEVVDLGGGTPKMFENIATFTQQMKEIAKEQTSNLRVLVFVPYFGAVMMIATTIMMMSFLIGAPGDTSTTDASFTGGILLTGTVAQSWIMGFASGKMGEGSMGAGFKHAAALVAISLLTIFILKGFFVGVG